MIKIYVATACDENTALLPPRQWRKKIVRRSQLDIKIHLVLERGDGLEETRRFGLSFQVQVDRRRTPPVKNGRAAAGEVNAAGAADMLGETAHESFDFGAISFASHEFALLRLENLDESLLRDVDLADPFHALLAFFLFLEQLPFAGNIAAVAFRGYVFSQR